MAESIHHVSTSPPAIPPLPRRVTHDKQLHPCIYTCVTQRTVYALRTLRVSSSQVAIHRVPSIDQATDRYSYSLLTRLCLRAIKPGAGRFVDGHEFSFFSFLFSLFSLSLSSSPLRRKPV